MIALVTAPRIHAWCLKVVSSVLCALCYVAALCMCVCVSTMHVLMHLLCCLAPGTQVVRCGAPPSVKARRHSPTTHHQHTVLHHHCSRAAGSGSTAYLGPRTASACVCGRGAGVRSHVPHVGFGSAAGHVLGTGGSCGLDTHMRTTHTHTYTRTHTHE